MTFQADRIMGMFLSLIHISADAMPYAIVYLRITTLGILGNMGYNFSAGILRGLGNSTSSLLFLGISLSLIHISDGIDTFDVIVARILKIPFFLGRNQSAHVEDCPVQDLI